METQLQLILPSAVLPLLLSALLFGFSRRHTIVLWGLPLIWFPSYVWITGWPSLLPGEAHEWLWLLAVFSVLIRIVTRYRLLSLSVLQTLLLTMVLIAAAWPVLKYQFDLMLVIELISLSAVGFALFCISGADQARSPALSMAISSGGMAVVVALAGSLSIGQLAGALASVLAVFAVFEIFRMLQQPSVHNLDLIPVMQLYLVILAIARIFADVPLGPVILLLAAPLAGMIPGARYAAVFSAVAVIAAISWLLLTAEPSAYY